MSYRPTAKSHRRDDAPLTFRPRSSSGPGASKAPDGDRNSAGQLAPEEVEEPLYEVEDQMSDEPHGSEEDPFRAGGAADSRPQIALTDDGPYMDASGYRKPSAARFRPSAPSTATPLSQAYGTSAQAQTTGDLSGARERLNSQERTSSQGHRSRRSSERPASKTSRIAGGVAALKKRVSRQPQEGRGGSASLKDARSTSAVGSKLGDDFKGVRTGRRGRAKEEEGSKTPKAPWQERFAVPLVVLGLLLVAAVVLYGPTCNYYAAQRDGALYQAQLDAFTNLNEEEKERIRSLSTEQGIEDEARLHGYVKEGEQAVTVSGLPDEASSEAAPIPDDIKAEVLSRPDPWYIQALDGFFGYKKGA